MNITSQLSRNNNKSDFEFEYSKIQNIPVNVISKRRHIAFLKFISKIKCRKIIKKVIKIVLFGRFY